MLKVFGNVQLLCSRLDVMVESKQEARRCKKLLHSMHTEELLTSFYVSFKETTVYRKVTLAQLKVTLAQLKVTLAQLM